MQSIILLGLLGLSAAQSASSAVGPAPSAPVIKNNVPGVTYGAEFDGTQGAGIKGLVTVSSNANNTGTTINVNLNGIPDQSDGRGPYLYHIHVAPVAANGSCATALAHLDPTNRGEKPACDANAPETCQVGDLAGKYGKITQSSLQQTYYDPFTSTTPGDAAFVGNRSIVIHYANTTRIACANFKLTSGGASSNGTGAAPYPTAGSGAGSASPSGSSGAKPSGTGAPIAQANSATSVSMSMGALVMAMMALVL